MSKELTPEEKAEQELAAWSNGSIVGIVNNLNYAVIRSLDCDSLTIEQK